MYTANSSMAIPILSIILIFRIVASVPEATPYDVFSTELITALVFGDEKRAIPKPIWSRGIAVVCGDGV